MTALWWYIFDDVNVMTNVTSWKHNIDVIRLMHTRIKYAISPLLLGNFNSNKEQIARKRLNSLKMWTSEIWKKLPEGPKSHDGGQMLNENGENCLCDGFLWRTGFSPDLHAMSRGPWMFLCCNTTFLQYARHNETHGCI